MSDMTPSLYSCILRSAQHHDDKAHLIHAFQALDLLPKSPNLQQELVDLLEAGQVDACYERLLQCLDDDNRIKFISRDMGMSRLGVFESLLYRVPDLDLSKSTQGDAVVLNPLPVGFQGLDHDSEPYRVICKGQHYQINWHMYFSEALKDHDFTFGLTNYFLDLMGSAFRVYEIDIGFNAGEIYALVVLNVQTQQQLAERMDLPFSMFKLDNIADFEPRDFQPQLVSIAAFYQPLIESEHTAELPFVLPKTASLSSNYAKQWVKYQEDQIVALCFAETVPTVFAALSDMDTLTRIRHVYNGFVAVARRAIADPRARDQLYQHYPLPTAENFGYLLSLREVKSQIKATKQPVEQTLLNYLMSDQVLSALVDHRPWIALRGKPTALERVLRVA